MSVKIQKGTTGSGISMTSFMDIVFQLLIFFLVATRFDQEERELPVALPEVVLAQPLAMTPELVVNITRDGKYVTSWGMRGNPPTETRPYYMNTVHAIVADKNRRLYVSDRDRKSVV